MDIQHPLYQTRRKEERNTGILSSMVRGQGILYSSGRRGADRKVLTFEQKCDKLTKKWFKILKKDGVFSDIIV